MKAKAVQLGPIGLGSEGHRTPAPKSRTDYANIPSGLCALGGTDSAKERLFSACAEPAGGIGHSRTMRVMEWATLSEPEPQGAAARQKIGLCRLTYNLT